MNQLNGLCALSGVNVVEGSSRMIQLASCAQWLDTGALQATCGCSLMHQSGRWKLHGNPTCLSLKLTMLHQILVEYPIVLMHSNPCCQSWCHPKSSCTTSQVVNLGTLRWFYSYWNQKGDQPFCGRFLDARARVGRKSPV